MAERLTKKISKTIQDKYSLGSYLYYDFAEIDDTNKLLNKLGKLEDIMERLGINFVEDLEDEIKSLRVDKYVYKKDRDNWKRACELACKDKEIGIIKIINNPEIADLVKKNGSATLADYFYQQTKKEKDEQVN